MRNLIAFLCIFLFLATGCKQLQPVTRNFETRVDSTETKVVDRAVKSRDTIVTVPGSNVKLEELLERLLKGETFNKESGNSKVTVRYIPETNKIQAECDCKEAEVKAQLFDYYVKTMISKEVVKESNSETTIEKRSLWRNILGNNIPAIFLGLIAIIILLKFKVR